MTFAAGDSDGSAYQLGIMTSNKEYYTYFNPAAWDSDANYCHNEVVVADMDASDTAYIRVHLASGTAQVDVIVAASWFTGCLLA